MNIKKLEDLSVLQMNAQDVALKGVFNLSIEKKYSSVIIPDDLKQETKDEIEELVSLQILSKGNEVGFEIGQYVSMKNNKNLGAYDALNEDGSERLFITGQHQIAYALNEVDYEL